jgi:hypothetical protein
MKCKALPVLLPSHVEVNNIFLPLHHASIPLPKQHPPTSIDIQYSWYEFISHYSVYALSLERLLSMVVRFNVPLTITIIRNFSYWGRLKNSLLCLNPFCSDTAARLARSRYRYHVRAEYLRHGAATNILSQTHDPRCKAPGIICAEHCPWATSVDGGRLWGGANDFRIKA